MAVTSSIKGFHVYRRSTNISEKLNCVLEETNRHSSTTIKVVGDANETIGHIPDDLSKVFGGGGWLIYRVTIKYELHELINKMLIYGVLRYFVPFYVISSSQAWRYLQWCSVFSGHPKNKQEATLSGGSGNSVTWNFLKLPGDYLWENFVFVKLQFYYLHQFQKQHRIRFFLRQLENSQDCQFSKCQTVTFLVRASPEDHFALRNTPLIK